MNKIVSLLLGLMAMLVFTNCKTEVEGHCDIQSFSFEFTESSIAITPIIGEEDNYSYTVTYYIDGTEIGKTRKAPYIIRHELSDAQLTTGKHEGEIKFNGKRSKSGVELYIERSFIFTYMVSENGDINLLSQHADKEIQ